MQDIGIHIHVAVSRLLVLENVDSVYVFPLLQGDYS